MSDIKASDRLKAQEAAISYLEKKYGSGTIMRMDGNATAALPRISTGSLGIDIAVGGGVCLGRIMEIFGQESSGKTTIALSIVAQFQKLGRTCVFVDTEHTFDASYARVIGVNVKDLIVSQPDYGEQALEVVETLMRSGAIDLVVVDSVAALTPKAEIDGDMGDSHMGLHARLMSQALRKLTALVSKTDSVIIFTNQMRSKIGVMFGNPETTTGGNALKFYASMRLEVKRIGAIKEKEEVVGSRTVVKVVKNKVAPPFKQAEFDIMYNEGISITGEVIDLGVKYNIIDKSGSWYNYKDIKLGQGRENVRQFLRENPSVFDDLYNQVRSRVIVGVEDTSTFDSVVGDVPFAALASDQEDMEEVL